jgi:tRNA(Arg) A34 adenosine deaminase TadA
MEGWNHEALMRRAIALARQVALEERIGGPFGAVIVRDGEIVGEAGARVVPEHDLTWHAEMAAIRDACRRLGTHDISGCVMYTSCECCAMCHAAAWRARLAGIYYAATVDDIQTYGPPGDGKPRGQFVLPDAERHLPKRQVLRDEMVEIWKAYQALSAPRPG